MEECRARFEVLLRGSLCTCPSLTCSNKDVDCACASSSQSEQDDEHELDDGGDEQIDDEAEEVGDASVVIVGCFERCS